MGWAGFRKLTLAGPLIWVHWKVKSCCAQREAVVNHAAVSSKTLSAGREVIWSAPAL